MTVYGITDSGFTLKRNYNIITDIRSSLSLVTDPVTGETLSLNDENDPLNQLANAVADQLSVCWEQLELAYNQFNPLSASGVPLRGLVQLNGILGQVGETDTNLRLRQQNETASTGSSQIESIYSSIAALPGVQFVRAYQNSTLTDPDGRGIPAKSIAVVAVGGDNQAIADTIFRKAPADCGIYGNTPNTCLDSLGTPYAIPFTRPVPVPINIIVNIQIIDSYRWAADGADRIKATLVKYAEYGQLPNFGLPPGVSVVDSQLYSPVNTVPGHSILSIQLSRGVSAPAVGNVAIAWNEVADISAANISVIIT